MWECRLHEFVYDLPPRRVFCRNATNDRRRYDAVDTIESGEALATEVADLQ